MSHYLDQAFTRVSAALELSSRGQSLDPQTMTWLKAQGDFAVQLLASSGLIKTSEDRGRLLELLLCPANTHEHIRQNAAARM